jgi:acyl carrier protein
MIASERIAEVVSRLTGVPVEQLKAGVRPSLPLFGSADALDSIELIVELEEEFDKETVRWALRYAEALVTQADSARQTKHLTPRQSSGLNPLWDRELDG